MELTPKQTFLIHLAMNNFLIEAGALAGNTEREIEIFKDNVIKHYGKPYTEVYKEIVDDEILTLYKEFQKEVGVE